MTATDRLRRSPCSEPTHTVGASFEVFVVALGAPSRHLPGLVRDVWQLPCDPHVRPIDAPCPIHGVSV